VGIPVVGAMVSTVGLLLVGICVSPISVGFAEVGITVVGAGLSIEFEGREVVGRVVVG